MNKGTKYNSWTVINRESYDKVLCECICGIVKHVRTNYLKQGKSKSCGCMNDHYKKLTCLAKYGTENPQQLDIVKDKVHKTISERDGTTFISQASREKIKQVNLEKRIEKAAKKKVKRAEKALKKEIEKAEKKATRTTTAKLEESQYGYWEVINIESYKKVLCRCICGIERYIAADTLRRGGSKSCGCMMLELVKQANLEKRGVEYSRQCKKVRDKGTKALLDKYGVEYISQNKDIKQKVKISKQKRFQEESDILVPGTKFGFWEILSQEDGSVQRYICLCTGCGKTQMVRKKNLIRGETKSCGCMRAATQQQTLLSNGNGIATSQQQIEIHEMLKGAKYNCELDSPLGWYSIDILIKDSNIAIEYDGGGHYAWSPEETVIKADIRRDKYLLRKGYKTLRIESRKDVVPTLEQIEEQLNILLNQDFVRIKIS